MKLAGTLKPGENFRFGGAVYCVVGLSDPWNVKGNYIGAYLLRDYVVGLFPGWYTVEKL